MLYFAAEGGTSFEEGTTPLRGLGFVVELIEVAIYLATFLFSEPGSINPVI